MGYLRADCICALCNDHIQNHNLSCFFMSSSTETLSLSTDIERPKDLIDGTISQEFSSPTQPVVKLLTPEALATFTTAQEKAGIVYISRIPPGMQPTKVRHLMSAYGEVGRVYLQQEGMVENLIR